MSRSDVAATAKFIEKHDVAELIAATGVSEARMTLVPTAALVLRQLVRRFKPHDIAVSSYGIREGMLYEQMPQRLRDRDPLIEACRFAEAKDARLPGFGRELHAFILPLFGKPNAEKSRIIKAACLLHDVSWRAHPDYRHEVCFDNATRANLGGLNHQERVFIGLALLHRYKNSREGSRLESLLTLLSEREIRDAEILGKAMRFGAMFSGQDRERMGRLAWFPKKKRLEFRLAAGAEALFGEVADARLRSLGASMGALEIDVIGA
jgi:exopolyphosphatase/guanosine-5'-triphosphate,3'-diphosphate pyrophosphatase